METKGYTYKASIAEGSFGKVVKAESIHLKKLVAIKIIGLNRYTTVNREKFVTQEKEIIRTLKHPNIVKTYDVFESRSEMVNMNIFLCFELILWNGKTKTTVGWTAMAKGFGSVAAVVIIVIVTIT